MSNLSIFDQLAELVDLGCEFRLTDWEAEFVDAMEKRVRACRSLTPAMTATISGIWDAVFIHGKRKARK